MDLVGGKLPTLATMSLHSTKVNADKSPSLPLVYSNSALILFLIIAYGTNVSINYST